MNSADKLALKVYAVQSLCQEVKASIQALFVRFKETPLDSWSSLKCIAQQIIVVAERVNSIRKTDATEIRPRKATYKDTGAAAELRELIDRKVRVISATLDQTIQDLDSVSENAEAVATEMQHVKNFLLRVAPLADQCDSDDVDDTQAEAIAFMKQFQPMGESESTDTELTSSGETIGAKFMSELLALVKDDDSSSGEQPKKSPASSRSPLAFLKGKVSGLLGTSQHEGSGKATSPPSGTAKTTTNPPAAKRGPPPRPPQVPPLQQPKSPRAGVEDTAAGEEEPNGANTPSPRGTASAPASAATGDASKELQRENSVSKKIMGMFRKAQKAVRNSVHPMQPSKSATDVTNTATSPRGTQSQAADNGGRPTTVVPPTPAPPPSTAKTPAGPQQQQSQGSPTTPRTGASSSPSASPPESPRDNHSDSDSYDSSDPKQWAAARSSRIMHPLNKRRSEDNRAARKKNESTASTERNSSSSSSSGSGGNSSAPTVSSQPRPSAASSEDEAAANAMKKLEQQREEALQKEVLDKFNLDGRMAQSDPKQLAASGGSRERRRAAIFTKAVDRYSQLHSNMEDPRAPGGENESDLVNIWEEVADGNLKVETVEGRQEVAAGTLNQLVKHLTSEHGLDGRFVQTFLLTYTSFTTPKMFLEKLKQRYLAPEAASLSSEAATAPISDSANTSSSAASPSQHSDSISSVGTSSTLSSLNLTGADPRKKLQLRVVNTLKKWLDVSFLDFNDELIGQVFEFVDLLKKDGNSNLATVIDNMLLTKLVGIRKKKDRAYDSPPPPPLVPKVPADSLTFEDIEVIELARQMTIWDHEVYTSIKASELLRQAWNKPHLRHRSPRVLEMIERFNSISSWVSGCVVRPETAKERARIFERFISVAQQLRVLNNFNSMNAVLSGLGSSAVFRLQATKELLSTRIVKKYEKLQQLMNSSGNFANYRAALRAASPPAVPYLGNYLSALVFIEEGNNDFVNVGTPETPRTLINFKKRRLVSRVIEEMRGYQVGGYYALITVPVIADFLSSLPEENEEQLYELSLIREPRKKT